MITKKHVVNTLLHPARSYHHSLKSRKNRHISAMSVMTVFVVGGLLFSNGTLTNVFAQSSVTNTASVSSTTPDPNPSNNTDSVTDTISYISDLAVTKTDNQTTTTPGSAITYVITVTNNGPSTVTSLNLADPVPTQVQNPTYTASTGTYDSATGNWTGLNLASGQSITLNMAGTVKADASGVITNTATVTPPNGTTDSNASNNTATDTTEITPQADLVMDKTSSGNFVSGANATYTLKVTNNGPSAATGPITISDTLPSQVTYVSAAGTDWTCTASGQTVTCTNPNNMANGASSEVVLTVKVN
jgi:uncharacterized repeat protein (TIGR01451 family)